MHKNISHVVGVDEAGRGPLAGPVSVGVVVVPKNFNWKLLPGVNDSKKLSEKKREEIFKNAQKLQKEGKLNFKVSMVSARVIDSVGISKAVKLGIGRALRRLEMEPVNMTIKLDGLLHAPEEYFYQETIIKGDSKEKIIGLASIMAKVTRDRYMVRAGKKYPMYDFDIHKGYGTRKHIEYIRARGLSALHRRSFTRSV